MITKAASLNAVSEKKCFLPSSFFLLLLCVFIAVLHVYFVAFDVRQRGCGYGRGRRRGLEAAASLAQSDDDEYRGHGDDDGAQMVPTQHQHRGRKTRQQQLQLEQPSLCRRVKLKKCFVPLLFLFSKVHVVMITECIYGNELSQY